MVELLSMAERLPISLPEVYRRVNNIEDPVKRAGAQAFAGIYAPTLRLPEYDRSSLNRTTMRNRALRVKDFAIREAQTELGLTESTETELFNFQEMDFAAQQAGLAGVDLLGLSARTRNVLLRSRITDLATLNTMSTTDLMRLGITGIKAVKEIVGRLNEVRRISAQEVEARIIGVFTEREEIVNQQRNKQKVEMGTSIREAAEPIFEVGTKLSDEVPLAGLYTAPDRDFNIEIPQEWGSVVAQLRPGQKGAINGALIVAMEHHGFKTVGEIRQKSPAELAELLGPNRAIFFKNAFGVPVMLEHPLIQAARDFIASRQSSEQ